MNYTKLIVGVLVFVAIAGGYLFPKFSVQTLGVASIAGGTNLTAKRASIAMTPISVTSTSTSILNTDSTDRMVIDAGVTCTGLSNMFGNSGAGVAAFQWAAATSSTPTTSTILAATLAAMNLTVATSSVDGFTATSTYTNVFSRRWNAGSYMIFETNATSSAAACTPFLSYVSS